GLAMSINLTDGIPTNFVDDFKNDLISVTQQKQSLFEFATMSENLVGAEDKAFDLIDKMEMQPKEGRNPPTPRNDISTQRRWVFTDPYHNAWQFDKDDDLSHKLNPAGATVREARRGRNRKVDDIILASFDATVQSGRRSNSSTITWASENGNVKYTDSSGGRTIPHDTAEGNASAADTGMTAEKAELIVEYFAKNEVDQEIPIFCAISPRQATNLFGQEQYVNVDYNTSKPLADGRYLKEWMGIHWIRSNKIVKGTSNDVDSDTNVYRCPAWAKEGIILGVSDSITVELDKLPELSYAQQVYIHMNMGAMRLNEDYVLFVECQ
ncbi:hypothetical protein LCGC14_2164360, partial [marine sediment metagenome]